MRTLIVTEGSENTLSLVSRLTRAGHGPEVVHSGAEALELVNSAELVLLDLELPDMDGLDVCRLVRKRGDVPLIAFTAGGDDLDRVLALQAGADDCLQKPYKFRELSARIEAVMRRTDRRKPDRSGFATLSVGGLCINWSSRDVSVHGEPKELTRKEFELLYYLASNPEAVVSRERLMEEIWGVGATHVLSAGASRTVDTHVSSLRGKLGRSSWIRTVRGVGFRFGEG